MFLPKACNIMLNDGTYLYNSSQVFDYLLSLGFVREDLEETLVYELDIPQQKESGDDWEAIADGYYNAYQNLCNEVDAECDKFLSGRKITKIQFVNWLKNIMEDALLNY